jgi:hypothetical protein
MTVWKNRIVGYDLVVPSDVLANPANIRRHGGTQRDAMRGSLDELGWIAPIVINRRTDTLVDGHMRVEEAISQGTPVIPAVYVDLTEDEERLALAVLDPIGNLAVNDQERLDELIASIDTDNAALNDLLASLSGEDVDGAPILPPKPPDPDKTSFVLLFEDRDEFSEFAGYLSLLPGHSPAAKILRLLRNTT